MLSKSRLNAVLAVLAAVCAGDLAAQQAATITGRVTGDGGAGVASAQVVVTHEERDSNAQIHDYNRTRGEIRLVRQF